MLKNKILGIPNQDMPITKHPIKPDRYITIPLIILDSDEQTEPPLTILVGMKTKTLSKRGVTNRAA